MKTLLQACAALAPFFFPFIQRETETKIEAVANRITQELILLTQPIKPVISAQSFPVFQPEVISTKTLSERTDSPHVLWLTHDGDFASSDTVAQPIMLPATIPELDGTNTLLNATFNIAGAPVPIEEEISSETTMPEGGS